MNGIENTKLAMDRKSITVYRLAMYTANHSMSKSHFHTWFSEATITLSS